MLSIFSYQDQPQKKAHTMKQVPNATRLVVILSLLLLISLAAAMAAPSGTVIQGNTTGSRAAISPATRSDSGGTVTTMVVSVTQQDINWKGYAGNITSTLTLDDANNKTIYQWSLVTLTGEIYASRSNSVTFSDLNCSNAGNVSAEDTAMGFAATDTDSINRTFNETTHPWFISSLNNISGCKSQATWINDSAPTAAFAGRDFQEVVTSDGSHAVFVGLLEDSVLGFDGILYNFQLILPQNKTTLTPTGYYFWVELG
jgi:hypothetical protein